MNASTAHAVVLIVGIAAYVALTLTGHDGNGVLAGVLGYGGGAAVTKATA